MMVDTTIYGYVHSGEAFHVQPEERRQLRLLADLWDSRDGLER